MPEKKDNMIKIYCVSIVYFLYTLLFMVVMECTTVFNLHCDHDCCVQQ